MRPRYIETIVLLGAISALTALSIDMYLPALPALEEIFNETPARVQLTLTSFFMAFAFGQATYGPLSDRFGRKPPLLVGLALFAGASAGCALSRSIDAMVVLRFVQAMGACAGGVISRAIVRDWFEPRDTARIFSMLMLVIGLAPMLGPLAGGFLLNWFGWEAIFWILSILGIACLLVVVFRLPESCPAEERVSLSLRGVLTGYGRILIHRHYLGSALTGGLSVAGMFAYITGSPFVFIQLFHVPADRFGWIFGTNALGFVIASQINGRLVYRFSPAKLLAVANLLQSVAGVVLLAVAVSGAGGMIGFMIPLFFYITSIGFILPNSTALAMAPFKSNAGAASALLGTLQFSIGAVTSTLMGMLGSGTPVPMAGLIAGCSLAGFILYRCLGVAS